MDMRYRGQLRGDQISIEFVPSGETFTAWETAIAHQDWIVQWNALWETNYSNERRHSHE
jgi:hypothetical protein